MSTNGGFTAAFFGALIAINAAVANGEGATATSPSIGAARAIPTPARLDPIRAAQVLDVAETTFPNLARDLDSAELFSRVMSDPSMRGNLRGRLAEEIFAKNYASDGWARVRAPNAPENDFYRRLPKGGLEGAQIKVHATPSDYFRSMRADSKAERFVVPDDHFDLLKKELQIRREGALRGGLIAEAQYYAEQESRLMKLGRTFAELDNGITVTAQRFRSISAAVRQAGQAASFIAIAFAVVEGSIAVYDLAVGKDDVLTFARRVGKIGLAGGGAWVVSRAAAKAVASAGASGSAPVAVAIVVATVAYLVLDWAVDKSLDSLSVAKLTVEDLRKISALGMPRSGTTQLDRF